MNYLVYLLLLLLFACSVGPEGSGSDSDKLQKLFNTMKSHMATCPKMETDHRFYSCPSHLWPGILQNFVQVVRSLGAWIRQRFGADDTFWRCLAEFVGVDMVIWDSIEELLEFRDEAIAWISLNRYLKFDASKQDITFPCLATIITRSDRYGVDTSVQVTVWCRQRSF